MSWCQAGVSRVKVWHAITFVQMDLEHPFLFYFIQALLQITVICWFVLLLPQFRKKSCSQQGTWNVSYLKNYILHSKNNCIFEISTSKYISCERFMKICPTIRKFVSEAGSPLNTAPHLRKRLPPKRIARKRRSEEDAVPRNGCRLQTGL